MRTSYFSEKYYTINQIAQILEVKRYRLEAVLIYSGFPPPDLRLGRTRFWEKDKVKPYLPKLAILIGEGALQRRRADLVLQIKQFIVDHNLDLKDAYEVENDFRREYNVKTYTIRHYGGWVYLVSKAYSIK